MQRKNGILRRAAFAMITAIAVILFIAAIMTLALSLSIQTSKKTTDLYLYEQAVLYSKSAAELALLDIAKNGCSDSFNTTFNAPSGNPMFDANVTMRYIYNTTVAGCSNYFHIATPEQNGSVLMDISISVSDPDIATEPIRYFRRTLQKL